MEVLSDLHLHSKYSRACSKNLDIPHMEQYAKIKGINLLGTGDFQHPKWQQELKKDLVEDDTGILKTKNNFPFMLTSEISLIYSDKGKGRKVHNVIWAKNLDIAAQVSDALLKKGRIDYDGRPIFGMTCAEFTEYMKEVDKDIEVIPAHIWTPWFSMFGSKSGYDSIHDTFEDQIKHIKAVETGLSSDPPMNWRVSQLDDFSIVSFSDSHSYWPWRLGREATVFDVPDLTYDTIIKALHNQSITETIEVDPAYGKYHWDGHRNCHIVFDPHTSKQHNQICPVCKKELVIGVEFRTEELRDRPMDFQPKNRPPYRKLLPLSDIISARLGKAVATKSVWSEYYKLVGKIGSEYDILRKVPREKLEQHVDKKLADYIMRSRNQEIYVKPGYDGVYGVPQFEETQAKEESPLPPLQKKQMGLQDYMH